MAAMRLGLLVLLIAATVSSFTIANAEDSSKSEEHSNKDTSVSTDDSSQEDSKEKRSREEIMFGNQQNKPNGLVDDLMGMSDNTDDDDDSLPDKKSSAPSDDQKQDDSENDDKKRSPHHDGSNDMMMESGNSNWYNTVPVSSSALQYLANTPTLQSMPTEDFTNSLYDQEDLYRRKRHLMERRIPLRKRSLRSSLGQMIQKRGIRMPRRSMRLKRQVDMGDLLSLFGNERYYEDQSAVPGRFSGYPETPSTEFRYPATFRHRDGGILSSANEFDENNEEMVDGDNVVDIDDLMLLPPNARYLETPEVETMLPYRTREEENEAIQKWLARHTTPNVFSVSRRSSPLFYPMDYRYIPGFRKRSIFGNRMGSNRFAMEDVEDQEPDFGKWGRVVQVPETYASPEDVARLYGLANLMAEGDENEAKKKRRT
ncbi:uncharacterized protein LOC129225680 isoform X2 [Uloborus diversus]|uniref:uncharacterized protein LOC129225680 isoform X2 n=1 Tax=Uloborus diversus TaxID=327109 RepID=UPI00240A1064|nr:uncharacterized protein LOC129225680 isoform X2 [Uloborus diversus]